MSTLRFCERPELVYVGKKTTVQDVMEELDSLRAEAERLRADAERYQYLRNGNIPRLHFSRDETGRRDYGTGEEFDANVDINMKLDNILGI